MIKYNFEKVIRTVLAKAKKIYIPNSLAAAALASHHIDAAAYLDPGSISLWVQGIIAGFVAIGLFAKQAIQWIKSMLTKKNCEKNENQDD